MEVQEQLIRKVVREELDSFLEKFFIKMRLETIPSVSKEEQENIEKLYGKELLEDDNHNIIYSRKIEIWIGKLNTGDRHTNF